MTATTVTARDEIRAVAAAHGWQTASTGTWHDTFLRPAALTADSGLARMFAVIEHDPTDKVYVGYDDLGRVTDANWATPGQQSVILGYHVGSTDVTGTGKRARVLALLTDGLPGA